MNYIFSRLILAIILFGMTPRADAQLDYNKILCISNSKREEMCSVTITKKAIILKYITGRNELIKMAKIKSISSMDESVRKGFIFTRVDRRYVYLIDFLNVDNDSQQISIAFDDYLLSKEFDSLLSVVK